MWDENEEKKSEVRKQESGERERGGKKCTSDNDILTKNNVWLIWDRIKDWTGESWLID